MKVTCTGTNGVTGPVQRLLLALLSVLAQVKALIQIRLWEGVVAYAWASDHQTCGHEHLARELSGGWRTSPSSKAGLN